MKEVGIYIHIPFCKSKCYYCDFISFSGKEKYIEDYVNALIEEIKHKSINNYHVNTIFIGGGTPSIIDAKYIKEIIETIKEYYDYSSEMEVTIEVNPGTVTKEKLETYYKCEINRLSVGLQSANDNILKEIGRIHTFEEYKNTIEIAKKVGFKNINSDIIIGLPNQTIYDIENTIDEMIKLELKHISVYSLILEENTKLFELVNNDKIKLPDDELERYMYWYAKRRLEDEGYKHYEISNFAKPGYESKHNLDCWNQKEYIGFGINAASYEDDTRYKNIISLNNYIKNIENKDFDKNKIIEEKQSKKDKANEYVILGLRKIDGIDSIEFENKFKINFDSLYRNKINKLISMGLIYLHENKVKLTDKGIDLANIVWEEFID